MFRYLLVSCQARTLSGGNLYLPIVLSYLSQLGCLYRTDIDAYNGCSETYALVVMDARADD